ncbi:ABC transporter ATP-binding protein [Cryptosporangium phraense]|uniref:ABC transporter ATP-binding protein n=1 Tax=Cryptosporangium phraense TaxID=2593070 RepID=A0A545ALQ8_9ACTN|nr:ABC transporter ATP-binding protein [Cryptosporangium phraense]TQS42258.1 ABC transporter ATP-binding protein [Cryptosporangium phraense]
MTGRIVVSGLTKQFGAIRAVDDLSFTVEPGTVTGFLGPNGAGKTTTLRMLLGLVAPTAGSATIGGLRYADLPRPLAVVGAALEASGFHKRRTGRAHLRILCAAAGLPARRADEVLELVGMTPAAGRRVGGYSMGMRQRLGLAQALLGDPQVLILDEPANGLDPAGIHWLRELLRSLAAAGKTVLVSSHLLSEVEQTVDDVVIIAAGRSVRQGRVSDLKAQAQSAVRVRTPSPDRLVQALPGVTVRPGPEPGVVLVERMPAADIGRIALAVGVELHELTPVQSDLQDLFLALTGSQAGVR